MATYTWKGGFDSGALTGEDYRPALTAQDVGDAIVAAGTAQGIVDAARDPSSILHGLFEWAGEGKNTSAKIGERDRIDRAIQILRDLVVS